jgi:hypothetical protein
MYFEIASSASVVEGANIFCTVHNFLESHDADRYC